MSSTENPFEAKAEKSHLKKSHEELNSQQSKKQGVSGFLENLMRKFKSVTFVVLLSPILILFIFCVGVALTPGAFLFHYFAELTANSPIYIKAMATGLSFGAGYFLYGLTIIFVVPLVNLPFIPFVRAYRGAWFSVDVIPWYVHNALIYLVRYTILDLMVPTPIGNLFYRMMGMKMGKGVMINSTNISDACLIELDDYVTIGGSASIMAHYGMAGYLIIDKLKIGRGSSVGLNANILGGVTIGKNVTVAPGTVVLPKTVLVDGSKYLGNTEKKAS